MRYLFPFLCLFLGTKTALLAQFNYDVFDYENYELQVDLEKVVHKDIKNQINVNEVLKSALINFKTEHTSYDRIYLYFSAIPLISGYSRDLLMLLNLRDTRSEEYKKKLSALKKAFFANKNTFEKIYDLSMPQYLETYEKMTVPQQQAYLDYVQNGIDYAQNFDLKTEEKDLKSLDNFAYRKGDLNAFIFRRIKSGEMSQKDILYWLKKMHKDLSTKNRQIEKITDEYIISTKPFYDANYWAYKFGNIQQKILLKKENDDYSFLFPKNCKIRAIRSLDDKEVFELEHPDNSLELVIASTKGSGKLDIHKLNGRIKQASFRVPNGFAMEYTSNMTELFRDFFDEDKSKHKHYMFTQLVGSFYFPSPDLILGRCRDATLESLIINPKDGKIVKRDSFDTKVNYVKEREGFVTYKKKKNKQPMVLTVENGKIIHYKLYYGLDYLEISRLGDYFFFKTNTESGEAYGFLSVSSGGLIGKAMYKNVIPLEGALLLQKNDDSNPYYALFSNRIVPRTKFLYEVEKGKSPNYNNKDKTIIFYKNKYSNGTLINTYATLIRYDGVITIYPKSAIIRRLYVPNLSGQSYYVVSTSVKIQDGKKIAVGPFAIYDNKGVAITKFDLDEIKSHLEPSNVAYDEENPQLIKCVKKGKDIKINLQGKVRRR